MDKTLPNSQELSIERMVFAWDQTQVNTSALGLEGIDTGWFFDGDWSYAAYSLADIEQAEGDAPDKPLEVLVRLHSQLVRNTWAWVRAVPTAVPKPGRDFGFGHHVSKLDALGAIEPTKISFDSNGVSVIFGTDSAVPLPLKGVDVSAFGVGIHDIAWQWECAEKTSGDEEPMWTPFGITQHRIFITFSQPNWPWSVWPHSQRKPAGSTYPTVHSIQFACNWAAGCKTPQEAATTIANKFFEAGRKGLFKYNTASKYLAAYRNANVSDEASAEYNSSYFFFTEMLQRLTGAMGLGELLNCEDCAHTVVALANVLGCNLQVGYLMATDDIDASNADNEFALGPFRAIGFESFKSTCENVHLPPESSTADPNLRYFACHAIAWESNPDCEPEHEGDFSQPDILIYDACLQFGSEAPYSEATNLAFGTCATPDKYRAMLTTQDEAGCARAIPQPKSVQLTMIQ